MKYRDLEWILSDKISMVSNDLWKYVHLYLQNIKCSREPFGGVNIIAFGDLYQLQHVKQMFIFMGLRHNCGPVSTNLWCEYFTMYALGEIMHQKDDNEFAELLNRLHIHKHTTADLNLLSSRTIMEEQRDELSDIPHFFPTRNMVARYNDMLLQNTIEHKIAITVIDIPPNDISPKFREQLHDAIDKWMAESTGGLLKQITIALNHRYDVISNIAVEDGIMNGVQCCVKYIQPQDNNSDFPAIIWVNFVDECIGSEHGKKYCYLVNRKQIHKEWTPIFAQKRTF